MNASKPYFSIIIPSYNQGRYLYQAINSVIKQSCDEWELIILDGGSDDDSVSIIKKFAKKFPKKIQWRSYPDDGQVAAINEGISKARGEIISYLNSDDYYLSGALGRAKKSFDNSSVQWLVGNCRCNHKKLGITFKIKELVPYDLIPQFMLLANFINQPAVFIRSNIVKKVGLMNKNFHYAFDYDYWLRCLKIATPKRIRYDLAVFRIHDQSKGSTAYKDQFREDFLIGKKYTRNKLFIFLHFLINQIIGVIYSLTK